MSHPAIRCPCAALLLSAVFLAGADVGRNAVFHTLDKAVTYALRLTAIKCSLWHCRQAAGGASRQHAGDTTSMQHGLEVIFRLGSEAIGRNVHVFQSEAGSWYNAHIKQCRPRQGLLSVQYESGDQDTLKAKDEQKAFNIRLMPLSARRP